MEELLPPPLYTTLQANVLAMIPKVSGPLSLVGSSLILWTMWFDHVRLQRHQILRTSVYHRLILAISIVDAFASLQPLILGPWAVPSDWQYGRAGRGNQATCNAMGFWISLTNSAMWYTAFLALYFVGRICLEAKEATLAKWLEPVAHIISVGLPLFSSIAGLAANLFHPIYAIPGICWFSEYPPLCRRYSEQGVECEDSLEFLAQNMYAIFMLVIWLSIFSSMAAIVLKVKRQERKLARYAVSPISSVQSRSRETAQQGMYYILSFICTFFPGVIVVLITRTSGQDPRDQRGLFFMFAFLTKLCTPLQGFFNAFIYFRNRFSSFTKEGESLAFVLKLPLIGPCIAKRTAHATHRVSIQPTTEIAARLQGESHGNEINTNNQEIQSTSEAVEQLDMDE